MSDNSLVTYILTVQYLLCSEVMVDLLTGTLGYAMKNINADVIS